VTVDAGSPSQLGTTAGLQRGMSRCCATGHEVTAADETAGIGIDARALDALPDRVDDGCGTGTAGECRLTVDVAVDKPDGKRASCRVRQRAPLTRGRERARYRGDWPVGRSRGYRSCMPLSSGTGTSTGSAQINHTLVSSIQERADASSPASSTLDDCDGHGLQDVSARGGRPRRRHAGPFSHVNTP